jgi:hypothetical protein
MAGADRWTPKLGRRLGGQRRDAKGVSEAVSRSAGFMADAPAEDEPGLVVQGATGDPGPGRREVVPTVRAAVRLGWRGPGGIVVEQRAASGVQNVKDEAASTPGHAHADALSAQVGELRKSEELGEHEVGDRGVEACFQLGELAPAVRLDEEGEHRSQ